LSDNAFYLVFEVQLSVVFATSKMFLVNERRAYKI